MNGKGGRTLFPPCLQCACKGGGGRAAGVGCSWGRWHCCPRTEGKGDDTLSLLHPWHACKAEGMQSEAGQGETVMIVPKTLTYR